MIVNVLAIWAALVLLILLWVGCAGAGQKRADEVAHRHVLERNAQRNAQRRARCAAYRRDRNQFRDQRENN